MCAVFGFVDYGGKLSKREKIRLTNVLARACEARGRDACGISYVEKGKLQIHKRPLPAHLMNFQLPEGVVTMSGHTRLATQGDARSNINNHPFSGTCGGVDFTLSHNGIIYNDVDLHRERMLPDTPIQTDSYVAVQLLEKEKRLDLEHIKMVAEVLEGSFVLTILDEKNNLTIVRGNNPCAVVHLPKKGCYVYASTSMLLNEALSKMQSFGCTENVTLKEGDIIQIAASGKLNHTTFDMARLRYPWYCYDNTFENVPKFESQYVRELKQMAEYLGYSRRQVDLLLQDGLSADEIAELFYELEG